MASTIDCTPPGTARASACGRGALGSAAGAGSDPGNSRSTGAGAGTGGATARGSSAFSGAAGASLSDSGAFACFSVGLTGRSSAGRAARSWCSGNTGLLSCDAPQAATATIHKQPAVVSGFPIWGQVYA